MPSKTTNVCRISICKMDKSIQYKQCWRVQLKWSQSIVKVFKPPVMTDDLSVLHCSTYWTSHTDSQLTLIYSMVTFCANSFRLTEACSCTILLSINNSRSGQEHAYTSGCTAHCPWKCKRIFFLSPRPKIFQTHHSLTKNSYVHWLKTSNPYNSFLPSS